MKLADAIVLRAALEAAIALAESDGSDEVRLQDHLSAELGTALGELESEIAKAKAGG